ncbi:hypothetical protein JB92DRAFT_1635706 [Gautieria morchelliformis]|nr:hypothetical protein JB92DRAFT_1635706 [Gautieria morchelliformis]
MCLPDASLEFMRFCICISQSLVEPLKLQNGKPSENFMERQIGRQISDAARSLTGVINEVARPRLILELDKDEVAKMTFQRFEIYNCNLDLQPQELVFTCSPAQLSNILKNLDEQLGLRFSNQKPTKIIPALILVEHCLLMGSDEFVQHYRVLKGTFNVLDQHQNSQVRSHANLIASLLDDQSHLKRQRQALSMSTNRSRGHLD